MPQVTCECGHRFVAADDLAGGLTNCPQCGKATAVPGLRDPLWRFVQVLAVLAWCGGVAFAYENWGLTIAVLVGLGLAGLFALIRLAF